jgi:4-diphosphocytidyl-2-C-methyl-D-erythritol kinase
MIAFPPCKINLGLHILRKRSDGYHDIETCFYPIPFTDILEIVRSEKVSFSRSGDVIPGHINDNLCLKAYELLAKKHSLPAVNIHLHKSIPTGAGLGGGSSDAAYTLRLLNHVFELGLAPHELAADAVLLGSDCAFFIYDSPMVGKGRGEVLSPSTLSLKGYYFILMNPGIHVSTPEAYAGVVPVVPEYSIDGILQLPVAEWRGKLKNDFENTVFAKHPRIAELRDFMYGNGALYAAMSGSGSSVFGIFEKKSIAPPELAKYVIWQGFMP